MSYLKRHGTLRVPSRADPGSARCRTSAGGFAWTVDDWSRLRRFLILGSEGGSYYAAEKNLTRENAKAVARCVAADGLRTVAEIVAVSTDGRAPKTIRRSSRSRWRRAAVTRRRGRPLSRPCRTCAARARTCSSSRRSSRPSAAGPLAPPQIGRWYAVQPVDALAYQAVKYRQREGVHTVTFSGSPTRRDASALGTRQSRSPTRTSGCSSGSPVAATPTGSHESSRASSGRSRRRRRQSRRSSSASTGCLARRCGAEHLASPDVWRRSSRTCR